jgi:ABC-type lipoprotein export system ATPase subunit
MTSLPAVATSQNGAIAIHSENLCRHYRMGETLIRALDGVSFDVRAGDFVALLGSSGSGKSSLLNLIAGLDHPTSGSVVVQGNNLAELSREDLAKHRLHTVGMVFQSFNLIPTMTLLENVELPMRFAEVDRSQRNDLARQALKRVGLEARTGHRPSELSGGEQQRASLARALINRPQLLLADEPTGNLDSATGEDVLALILELRAQRSMTVVVATHDPGVAAHADRVIHLRDGSITDDTVVRPTATPDELMARINELSG